MAEPRPRADAPGGRPDAVAAVPGTGDAAPALTVLYDGACPLCRREIGVYRGLRPTAPVRFVDVGGGGPPLPPGTTREQLLARFHVLGRDGVLLDGAQAFLALWAVLPGWRWLARAVRCLPGAARAMERAYRLFLRWRPALQRGVARLERRRPGRRGSGEASK